MIPSDRSDWPTEPISSPYAVRGWLESAARRARRGRHRRAARLTHFLSACRRGKFFPAGGRLSYNQ